MQENGSGHESAITRNEWIEHRNTMQNAARKIDEMHQQIPIFLEHTSHLKKLDYLRDIKDSLLGAAIGRDHIPQKMAMRLFSILGFVSIALVLAIVFMLTGEKWGWIPPLNH